MRDLEKSRKSVTGRGCKFDCCLNLEDDEVFSWIFERNLNFFNVKFYKILTTNKYDYTGMSGW